jgi:hypothetical protein
MTIRPTLKVRQIFFSINSTLLNFDLNKVSSNLTKAWNISLSYGYNFKNALVNVTAIEKNLYYEDRYVIEFITYLHYKIVEYYNCFRIPLIGIKYIVAINNVDPDDLFMLEPSRRMFEDCFYPYTVHIGYRPLLARRFESSNLIP